MAQSLGVHLPDSDPQGVTNVCFSGPQPDRCPRLFMVQFNKSLWGILTLKPENRCHIQVLQTSKQDAIPALDCRTPYLSTVHFKVTVSQPRSYTYLMYISNERTLSFQFVNVVTTVFLKQQWASRFHNGIGKSSTLAFKRCVWNLFTV